jgi:uncharacterized protein
MHPMLSIQPRQLARNIGARNYKAAPRRAAVALSVFSAAFWLCGAASVTAVAQITPAATVSTGLPVKPLKVGTHAVAAEIAATPADRQQGLMFRASMPANHGMLFVFDETAAHCFWMKNTPLPLSIGFFDDAGQLINTLDMAPFTENPQCPSKPARYALEMNQGWFAKHKIKPGAVLTGLPKP